MYLADKDLTKWQQQQSQAIENPVTMQESLPNLPKDISRTILSLSLLKILIRSLIQPNACYYCRQHTTLRGEECRWRNGESRLFLGPHLINNVAPNWEFIGEIATIPKNFFPKGVFGAYTHARLLGLGIVGHGVSKHWRFIIDEGAK